MYHEDCHRNNSDPYSYTEAPTLRVAGREFSELDKATRVRSPDGINTFLIFVYDLFLFGFVCMGALPACMSCATCMQCRWRPVFQHQIPLNWSDRGTATMWCWGPSPPRSFARGTQASPYHLHPTPPVPSPGLVAQCFSKKRHWSPPCALRTHSEGSCPQPREKDPPRNTLSST